MTRSLRHDILSRHRPREFAPTGLADFTTDPGTEVDAAALLRDPAWSLYALELETGRAIFVHLAPGTDLSRAAFIPQAQFAAAQAVLSVPLDDLSGLSADLPAPERLILLFSIGRCGTTLANHILNTVPDTFALSEPRAFVTLALARHQMPPARAEALIAAVTRLMFRAPQGLPSGDQAPRHFAIKFHSQVLYQADLFHRAFPQAKFLFLYRDAQSWASSMSRFLQNLGEPLLLTPEQLARTWWIGSAGAPLDELAPGLDITAPLTAHAPLLACVWAHLITCYRLHLAKGLKFHALRYDDLTRDREGSIRALLSHCDLPASTMAEALATFDRDSQAGTEIAQGGSSTSFSAADVADLRATLDRLPDPLPWDIRF